MKIYPIGKALINGKGKKLNKSAFCSNGVSQTNEESNDDSFHKRKSRANVIGFLTGIVGLGLGLLWIAGRLKKMK